MTRDDRAPRSGDSVTDPTPRPYKKKLIEVALPLEAINTASAREKSIRHGHPSTLHLWWSPKTLAACRAVLFASLVDDPTSDPRFSDRSEAEKAIERERLHEILRELVLWENSRDQEVLQRARDEITRCWGEKIPPVLDPFCGSGRIPLEAQRLGLIANASDLNPVAVLITRALIEIPARFRGSKPVHPIARKQLRTWSGAEGLAEDVRAYGSWICEEAERRIGHIYRSPNQLDEHSGSEGTVQSWLWARTVTCPNPACKGEMPLVSSFFLSTRKGREWWVKPVLDRTKVVSFQIQQGLPQNAHEVRLGTGIANDRGGKAQATFRCVICGSGIAGAAYIDEEANAGRMGTMPLAKAVTIGRTKTFVSFQRSELVEVQAAIDELLERFESHGQLPTQPSRGTFASNAQGRRYWFHTFRDYFAPRQQVLLATFSELINVVRVRVINDAITAEQGLNEPIEQVSPRAEGYADAVASYLAFLTSRLADRSSMLASWDRSRDTVRNSFPRPGIAMAWDFAEPNPFGTGSGTARSALDWIADALVALPSWPPASVSQQDAELVQSQVKSVVCTDPPYYDSVAYGSLSDYFYV
jgi:putative DNA methylase